MTREEALKQYVKLDRKIEELSVEQENLKKFILAKVYPTKEAPQSNVKRASSWPTIIKTIKDYDKPLTVSEISNLTDLPVRTVASCLTGMRKRNYVNHDNGKYSLGIYYNGQ